MMILLGKQYPAMFDDEVACYRNVLPIANNVNGSRYSITLMKPSSAALIHYPESASLKYIIIPRRIQYFNVSSTSFRACNLEILTRIYFPN